MIGFVSEKYEVGNLGPGTISSIPGDPGGKSYGCYQLTKLMLIKYASESILLSDVPPFTPQFDDEWSLAGKHFCSEFKLEQNAFIVRTHYLPLAIKAKQLGYPTSLSAVEEMLFSLSVQHRRASEILVPVDDEKPFSDLIRSVYASRVCYVLGLESLNQRLKEALVVRYASELKDVLKLLQNI